VWAFAAITMSLSAVLGLVVILSAGPARAQVPTPSASGDPCSEAAFVRFTGDRTGGGCSANFSARVNGTTFGFGGSLVLGGALSILDGQVAGYHGPGAYRLQSGGTARSFVEVVERGDAPGRWEPAGGTVLITSRGTGLHISALELIETRSGQDATISVEGDITFA
jgi:hypothetical protein